MDARPDLFAGRSPGLTARLAEFVADARTDTAAGSRRREALLVRSAAEEGTFAGILVDLAERGDAVLVTGAGGRRLRGRIVAVGSDFAALRTDEGREVLVAHRGIAALTTEEAAPMATGDRALVLPLGLAEALAVLAEDRPRVLVVPTEAAEGVGGGLAGTLRAAGRDVAVLRIDGAGGRTAYVPMANLAEVALA